MCYVNVLIYIDDVLVYAKNVEELFKALADVVRAEAALSAAGTPVNGLPPPARIENLAVTAERPVNICDMVELTAEAWDEHDYESEGEGADSVITAAMRRAA